jgi:hypothetical protein
MYLPDGTSVTPAAPAELPTEVRSDGSDFADPKRTMSPVLTARDGPNTAGLNRAAARRAQRDHDALTRPGGPLAPECRHGDLRVLPCSNPAHPNHVHIWSAAHGEWLPCDDDSPLPAAVLAVIAEGNQVASTSDD